LTVHVAFHRRNAAENKGTRSDKLDWGAVEAEREATKKQTRTILISELKENVTAAVVAQWFSRFGDPVDVKMNPLSE